MPEMIEILFHMRCFVTCQIVLIVHHPKKKIESKTKKKNSRSFITACAFTSIECAQLSHPTLYKVLVNIFYISFIRISSINKLNIVQGFQVVK